MLLSQSAPWENVNVQPVRHDEGATEESEVDPL